MAIKETMAGVAYDGLFGGAEVEVLTRNVMLASGQNVKRGTLLGVTGGKAVAVAAEDINATSADTAGTAYITGYFNREKLIAASGDTVTAHEEELRDAGIFLTSMK
jgi:hypothetical protein